MNKISLYLFLLIWFTPELQIITKLTRHVNISTSITNIRIYPELKTSAFQILNKSFNRLYQILKGSPYLLKNRFDLSNNFIMKED